MILICLEVGVGEDEMYKVECKAHFFEVDAFVIEV